MNTVLYIEDEEDYQMLVQRILGKAGIDLHVASTAEEGLAALKRLKPDLLILDVNLPDGDGYAICHSLRQLPEWSSMPILMLTVKRRPEEWLKGFSCGADDYVAKPLNPPDLVERVFTCLDSRRDKAPESGSAEYLLIQAAVAGNKAAFEVLVQQYKGRLINSLRGLGRRDADAEDIAAASFARVFERLSQFRGQSSFYTWLYRIAANEAYRPKWRPSGPSLDNMMYGDDTVLPQRLGESDRMEEDHSTSALQSQLKHAVSCVPKPYRQMLHWHFLRNQSCPTIARRLKIPTGTVMSRLFRAKQLLRQSWRRNELVSR